MLHSPFRIGKTILSLSVNAVMKNRDVAASSPQGDLVTAGVLRPSRMKPTISRPGGHAWPFLIDGEIDMQVQVALIAATIVVFAQAAASAQDRQFGGYPCTVDCSGHRAGAEWAQRRGITNPDDCPRGNSQSFHEGCRAGAQGRGLNVQTDDDGEPIFPRRGRR